MGGWRSYLRGGGHKECQGGTMHRGLSMGFTVAIVINIKWISGKGIIGEY